MAERLNREADVFAIDSMPIEIINKHRKSFTDMVPDDMLKNEIRFTTTG